MHESWIALMWIAYQLKSQTVNYTPHFVKLLQDRNKEYSLSEKKMNEIQSFSQNKI